MRFYKGAHRALWEASKKNVLEEQKLYLVAEVDNNHDIHAIMLHNGRQKLGSVSADQAAGIKRILTEQRNGSKGDNVIVCSIDRIYESAEDFAFRGSVTIHGSYCVNERFARKFAEHNRKD